MKQLFFAVLLAIGLSACQPSPSTQLPVYGDQAKVVPFERLFKPSGDGRYKLRHAVHFAANFLPGHTSTLPPGDAMKVNGVPFVVPGGQYEVVALETGTFRILAINGASLSP